jgi:hypothetical protein
VVTGAWVTGVDCTAVGEAVVAGAVVVTVAVGLGEGDAVTVGDTLAEGDAVTVGDALWVTVTGADVLGVAVTGMDVRGEAEGAGDEVVADVVGCADGVPEGCTELPVSATPVNVHPATSPTVIDAMASGRHMRRRERRPGPE